MNLNIIFTIFQKDFKSFIKNKTILIIVLTPIMLSLIFSTTFSSAEDMVVSIALYDEGTNMEFINYLKSIKSYDIIVVESTEHLKELVYKGDVPAAIIIPKDFSNNIKSGIKPSLHIVYSPYNTKSIIFLQTYRDRIMEFAKQDYPVNISLEATQINSQAQRNIPTWILFAAIFVGISILPNTLTTEKEKKTLDAILVSPASEKDVIYSKSVFGLFLTLVISLLILFINDGFVGNVPTVLLFIFLGSTAFTGLGLLIASYSESYSSASILSTISMMPLMLLALLADTSKDIERVSYLVPSTYMLNGIKDAMFNNKGFHDVYLNLLVLIIFNVIVYALTIHVIKKTNVKLD